MRGTYSCRDSLYAWCRAALWRAGCVLLLALSAALTACGRATPVAAVAPTPTVQIRHRDALRLMWDSGDLGAGYSLAEEYRLEAGKGWGEDTTRLSGYRKAFEGGTGVFSRIVCQIECYISIRDAQGAYRSYREKLTTDLKANAAYGSVSDSEEGLLGDWNRMYVARARDTMTVHLVFLRENVFVELVFTGPNVPEVPDRAARQARLLDERIFQR